MNVLVYSGPEVVETSLKQTLTSLRSLLSSRYAVQTIPKQPLASHPWTDSCSLLVFPACHTISLPIAAVARVQTFVENGGAFLGLAVGATYSSAFMTGSANEELSFLDRVHGHRIYIDSEAGGKTAALSCNIGAGKVILWGPSLEYPLTQDDAASKNASFPMSQERANCAERERRKAMQDTLRELGLDVPYCQENNMANTPLPQFLTCCPSKPEVLSLIMGAIVPLSQGSPPQVLEDTNDSFQFHPFKDGIRLLQESRNNSLPTSNQSTKHIVVCTDGKLPAPEETPLFDMALFYDALSSARAACGLEDAVNGEWGMGEALLYGELVTSTQTMLDKNTHLLSALPTPLLSFASQQLSGRGRGSNVWLSSLGGLQFSLLLRVSLSRIPAVKLVFVQYLFGLAVTEACREENVLGASWGEKVRLKWPNDLYATFSDQKREFTKKVGGVLVTTSFTGGNVDLVIGCGLNLLNAPHIPSLSQLLPQGTRLPGLEHTTAVIMAKFEKMWDIFVSHNGSFDPFMELYLERWLHSDQLVTLTTTVPPTDVRVIGITDHGLLRTIPERSWSRWDDGFIDLQPDGNSFDMMTGMIRVKNSW